MKIQLQKLQIQIHGQRQIQKGSKCQTADAKKYTMQIQLQKILTQIQLQINGQRQIQKGSK